MKSKLIFKSFIITFFCINLIKSEIVFVFEQFKNGVYIYNPLGDDIEKQKANLNLVDKKISPASIRSFYLLGFYIKEKYKNIINSKITSKNVFIYSKELDIHVLSAKSQLLGMFPLEEGILLNQIEIDLAFPQTAIPLEAQEEINQLGRLSVPKSIKPFALRYFSDEERQNLLSINDECPRLTKIKEENVKSEVFQKEMKDFNNKHGQELLSLFKISNSTLIEDYNYLSKIIEHYISYYITKQYLNDSNIDLNKLNILYQDCIDFQNKSFINVEATSDISIISMSASLKSLIRFMEERIVYDQGYDENSTKIKDDRTPKFVIYSNNGLSLYYLQIFLKEAFDIPLKYPGFSANQFIELHRKDGIPYKDLTENDYHVEYYFNGELLLKKDFIEFKNKISELEWSSRKINNFCKHKSANILDLAFYFSLICSICIILVSIVRTKFASDRLKELIGDKF